MAALRGPVAACRALRTVGRGLLGVRGGADSARDLQGLSFRQLALTAVVVVVLLIVLIATVVRVVLSQASG